MAILSVAGAAVSLVSNLVQSSDPKKDAERKARIDADKLVALQGNTLALARIKCKANVSLTAQELALLQQNGGLTDGGCSLAAGSDVARAYAKAALLEIQARTTVASAATGLGVGALGVAEQANPGNTLRTISAAIPWGTVALIGIVLAGAYFAFRRR